MLLPLANAVLVRRAGVTVQEIPACDFSDALLDELYDLANALSNESKPHFRVHAHTTNLVHVFRAVGDGQLVGFQFWKCHRSVYDPEVSVIRGGKLRIAHAARGKVREGVPFLYFFLVWGCGVAASS